ATDPDPANGTLSDFRLDWTFGERSDGSALLAAGRAAEDQPLTTTDGSNILIITYDMVIGNNFQPLDRVDNFARITNFYGADGGNNYVTDPNFVDFPTLLVDDARVEGREVAMDKFLVSTDLDHTSVEFANQALEFIGGITEVDTLAAVSSTANGFGGTLAGVTNDGFAYDPEDPTSASPNTTFGGGNGWHASAAPAQLDFELGQTYIKGAGGNLFIDLWGRSGFTARDNGFNIVLTNGGTTVATLSNASIDDVTLHSRFDAATALSDGESIDGFSLVHPTQTAFTIMEARVAANASATSLVGSVLDLSSLESFADNAGIEVGSLAVDLDGNTYSEIGTGALIESGLTEPGPITFDAAAGSITLSADDLVAGTIILDTGSFTLDNGTVKNGAGDIVGSYVNSPTAGQTTVNFAAGSFTSVISATYDREIADIDYAAGTITFTEDVAPNSITGYTPAVSFTRGFGDVGTTDVTPGEEVVYDIVVDIPEGTVGFASTLLGFQAPSAAPVLDITDTIENDSSFGQLNNGSNLTFDITFTATADDLTGNVMLMETGGTSNGTGLFLIDGVPTFASKTGGDAGDVASSFVANPGVFANDLDFSDHQ
ncbi:MAG: hypothetical protein AAF226_13615, partial [Verrucomicrobiota bacterium]